MLHWRLTSPHLSSYTPSFCVSIVYYARVVGVYATFGSKVAHDVLVGYPASPLVSVARVAVAIVVAFSYPLQSHPSRTCTLSLIDAFRRSKYFPKRCSRAECKSPVATVHLLRFLFLRAVPV